MTTHWVSCWDPAWSALYYYDFFSGEWTWERPPKDAPCTSSAKDRIMGAVVRIQGMYRAKKARRVRVITLTLTPNP